MPPSLPIKQRLTKPENVAVVRALLSAKPTRHQLVKALCQRLDLRDPKGDWQIATTTHALRDLAAQGHWTLPEPKFERTQQRSSAPTRLPQPVKAAHRVPRQLEQIQGLRLVEVETPAQLLIWNELIRLSAGQERPAGPRSHPHGHPARETRSHRRRS